MNLTANFTSPNISAVIQLNETKNYLLFIISPYSQVFVSMCTIIACLITFHQIYLHLKNYTCFTEQRYIIRILVIVPAYAVYSFLSLMLAIHAGIDSMYIDFIHDFAEAFAIYSFLALCYQYLGGEGNIMLELTGKTINFSIFYGTCCFAGKPYTILFLRFCKIATLQYTLIKPFIAIISVVLAALKRYVVGDFSPKSGYLYMFLINNITVTLALYGLLLFYFATREQLRPFSPLLKFTTIKAIIFFSFWQDVLFSILQWSHAITSSDIYPVALIANAYKHSLICIELVIVAIALRYAFPYSIYVLHRPPRLVFDVPSTTSLGWFGDSLHPNINFRQSHKSNPTKSDLSVSHGQFLNNYQSPYLEPLPWDIADPYLSPNPSYTNDKSNVIPSISASIKATIDPRDILVDAVHNFHPTYRHYTQTQLDDDT